MDPTDSMFCASHDPRSISAVRDIQTPTTMGLFTPKHKSGSSAGDKPLNKPENAESEEKTRASDQKVDAKADVNAQSESATENDDDEVAKKVYDKEKAVKRREPKQNEPETETELNTRLNALLYHTSNDSIDMYRQENNSLDLLGRLYYDDYDANDKSSVERVSSYTSLQQMMAPSIAHVTSGESSSSSSVSRRSRPIEGSREAQKEAQKDGIRDGHRERARERPRVERGISFERGVSFDTLDDSHHQLITLKVKHPDFKFRRNNKTYLIGFRNDAESLRAVEWAFQEMVIHGDTLIVLQVLDEKAYKFVDPELADSTLQKLETLNTYNRKVSMVYEVVIGRPQKLLKLAIDEYKPAMMIVGLHQYGQAPIPTSSSTTNLINLTHGLQPHVHHHHFSFLQKTSISKYFLMFALVPVILVKPFYQHQEKLKRPIDSETYFHDLIANIDVSHTREKKKKSRLGFISPTSLRNHSSTNLVEDRGRSESSLFTIGSRDLSSEGGSRLQLRSRSRSRLSRMFS